MDNSAPNTPSQDINTIPSTPPEEYETIATLPVSAITPQRLTQPTQLLEQPYSVRNNTVIQVAASSPAGPVSPPPRKPQGGFLSSLIAPSGTHFRPPAPGPAKRTPKFDLDDGPTYRGGSSDEESHIRSTDIKPSMFEKSIRSPEKEKIMESPVRTDPGSIDRFREITANAMYDPKNTNMKRSADEMNPAAKGVAMKKARQDAPSRAQPVGVTDITIHEIQDFRLRIKVERVTKVMPHLPVRTCMDALLQTKGNFDAALQNLAKAQTTNGPQTVVIDSSDDELSTSPATGVAPVAKQKIKARGTIQDKWAAMNLPTAKGGDSEDEGKPRRRLIRGPKSEVSSRPASPPRPVTINDSPPKKLGRLQKGRKIRSPDRSESPEAMMSDSDNSDVQVKESTAGGLDSKVLKFFNTCALRELADLASVPEETAQIIMSNRPYEHLDEVRVVSAPVPETTKPKGKRGGKAPKPIGDKIVDKCVDMWTGYLAIDALVSEVETLGKPVADEMKKWGVDTFGKREGELELTNIAPVKPEAPVRLEHDSGIATPSSSRRSPDSDDDMVRSKRKSRLIEQPSIMARDLVMKDYQVVGINWLRLLYENELSCILADDMGLGKTCQVIAFLAHLYETGVKGPHLIVVPSSTIENWLREFQKFCPTLNVMPYYAGLNERAMIRETIEDNRDDINVVITTYTIAKAKVDAKFLRDMDFTVCVYDEGHMLKNHQSQLYEKLIRIRARFRLLLTGTPLQNNLQELASLLGFILPSVFQEHKEDLHAVFSNKAKTTDESHATLLSAQRIERAKSMMKPFILRRKKHQVIDLPAKHSHVGWCQMKPSQVEIYDHEKDQVRQLLEDRAAGKKTGSKSANILMKLRQAAIHPLLARRHYTDETLQKMAKACLKEEKWSYSDPKIILEELMPYNDFECHHMCVENPNSLGKFKLKNDEWMDSGKVEQMKELLTRFIANGDRTLIFSQFTMVMDILEYVLETLQIEFVRLDGRTNVEDRQSILDAFHERTEIPVFLLSTKAGGAGINLACANRVIIFDSSFNPQEDVQAENRAHRVGQTREVEIYRLVTKSTIEEQIYALGQTKLALDQAVAGEDGVDSKKSEEQGMKVVETMMLAELQMKEQNKE